MKTALFIILSLFILTGFNWDWYLMCVKDKKENQEGVVISRVIMDKNIQKEWVILETIVGTSMAWVRNLEICSCSELSIEEYPNKDFILNLLTDG